MDTEEGNNEQTVMSSDLEVIRKALHDIDMKLSSIVKQIENIELALDDTPPTEDELSEEEEPPRKKASYGNYPSGAWGTFRTTAEHPGDCKRYHPYQWNPFTGVKKT